DPEHLYRVADQYLLRKNPQARAALHDIYLALRSSVPGFNWSEPRFAALYPVHPLVADVAAAVRLYAPRFAFLPFAAAAAARAVSRPALSLILLDEVFDRAEHDLRHSEDLKEALAAYDDLATRAVAQFPVMQRLQAKLVLKNLFIFSLDGRGVTARELCAALLLADESEAGATAVERIAAALEQFAGDAPPGAWLKSEDGGETRHRFQISASEKFEAALAASVERVPHLDVALDDLLRGVARARFDDWPLAGEGGEAPAAANFYLPWRGSERPGSFVWRQSAEGPAESPAPASPDDDWRIVMLAPRGSGEAVAPLNTHPAATQDEPREGQRPASFVWQPADLTAEESNVLRRLLALRSDAGLSATFGETARAAASTLGAQSERIWMRVYMDDGVLVGGGVRHTFSDEARAARTLAEALGRTFAPLFDERYPEHPTFAETPADVDVANLIDGLFGGAGIADEGMQHLARVFVLPLGLAAKRGSVYTLDTGDEALTRPWVREVLALADAAGGEVVPLEEVRETLRREPYGLLREAQNLLLAALVAQR
ncbi:MAG: hypothetical protein ACRD68_10660, partial [Pyrinomonadaceae bacterium]